MFVRNKTGHMPCTTTDFSRWDYIETAKLA